MIDTQNGTPSWYYDGNTEVGFNSLCSFYPAQKLGLFIVENDVQSLEKVGQVENTVHSAFH